MAVDETLAQASNALVYSAMLVYTAALLSFAVDLSGRGTRRATTAAESAGRESAEAVDRPAREPAYAAATAPPTGDPGVGVSAAADAPPTDPTPPAARPAAGASRFAGIAVSLTWLAFALHLGGVITRGLAVHRVPWGNMYEFAVTGAVVVTGVYLAVLRRRDVRYLGTFVVGPILLTLGLAVTVFYVQAAQLVPALNSFWLVIHVSVAFVASALFTLGFSTTVLQLVQQRREVARAMGNPPRRGAFMNALPASADLELSAYRLHIIAFPLWSFTLMAGAIWAEAAWGKYWNWDPKEVWTFVIWVVYAGYLHARATRGWDGRRAATVVLAGYACLLFNFLVVNVYFVGLHSYAK